MKKNLKIIILFFIILGASLFFAKKVYSFTICSCKYGKSGSSGKSSSSIPPYNQFSCVGGKYEHPNRYCQPFKRACFGYYTVFKEKPIWPCVSKGETKCTCKNIGEHEGSFHCITGYNITESIIIPVDYYPTPSNKCPKGYICYGSSVGAPTSLDKTPCKPAGDTPGEPGETIPTEEEFDPKTMCDGKRLLTPAQLLQCSPEDRDRYYIVRVYPSIVEEIRNKAVAIAESQISFPYIFGTQGQCRLYGKTHYKDCKPHDLQTRPDTHDCSQLTGWAYYWATNGKLDMISLVSQQASHPACESKGNIPVEKMKPGDLVIYGAGHIGIYKGIYKGEGQMIHAAGDEYCPQLPSPRPKTQPELDNWLAGINQRYRCKVKYDKPGYMGYTDVCRIRPEYLLFYYEQ